MRLSKLGSGLEIKPGVIGDIDEPSKLIPGEFCLKLPPKLSDGKLYICDCMPSGGRTRFMKPDGPKPGKLGPGGLTLRIIWLGNPFKPLTP